MSVQSSEGETFVSFGRLEQADDSTNLLPAKPVDLYNHSTSPGIDHRLRGVTVVWAVLRGTRRKRRRM
jgi:hypothetical protein